MLPVPKRCMKPPRLVLSLGLGLFALRSPGAPLFAYHFAATKWSRGAFSWLGSVLLRGEVLRMRTNVMQRT